MPSVQGKAHKGSQKWLQILVNDCPELLNREIGGQSPIEELAIQWLSPLRKDGYKEYRDQPFIDLLHVELHKRPLESFWPASGPRWDALGKGGRSELLLVEAKSHTKELVSSVSATAICSLGKIESSLRETKECLHRRSDPAIDWTKGVDQYANRLAHLYLLSHLNSLDAYLILLYFLNDNEMNSADTYVPSTPGEWISVVTHQDRLMGIRQRHPLSDRIIHAYIDVNDIEAYQ